MPPHPPPCGPISSIFRNTAAASAPLRSILAENWQFPISPSPAYHWRVIVATRARGSDDICQLLRGKFQGSGPQKAVQMIHQLLIQVQQPEVPKRASTVVTGHQPDIRLNTANIICGVEIEICWAIHLEYATAPQLLQLGRQSKALLDSFLKLCNPSNVARLQTLLAIA